MVVELRYNVTAGIRRIPSTSSSSSSSSILGTMPSKEQRADVDQIFSLSRISNNRLIVFVPQFELELELVLVLGSFSRA
jgi:hypothetical protein